MLPKNAVCYILEDNDDWVYIESCTVRGFVKTKRLMTGNKARKYVKKKGEKHLSTAMQCMKPYKNAALTYKMTTVYDVVAKKVYALSNTEELNIREDMSTDSEIVGKMQTIPFAMFWTRRRTDGFL